MVEFTFEPNIIVASCSGRLALADFDHAVSRAREHPLALAGAHLLVDLRDVSELAFVQHDLVIVSRRESEAASKLWAPRRIAIVASDDYKYGVSRMYQSQAGDRHSEVKVFRDRFLAHAWLRNPDEPDWPEMRAERQPPRRHG